MKKRNRMFWMVLPVFAVILCMATGVMATEQEHVHNWVLLGGNSQGHTLKCDGCSQSKFEDHTVDSSEICTVCGVYSHTHNWQREWANDMFHCIVCSGCSEKKTVTHSNNDAGVCTVCGFAPHEHTWQYAPGENYDNEHGLKCTQCAAKGIEKHTYGSDGRCTVCGNAPPHVHEWKWDGQKTNHLWDHFLVCACGAKTTERHQLYAWDGEMGDNRSHRALCGVCGHALRFDHTYDDAYFNGERCTVCGYPGQGTTVPDTKPGQTTPAETKPAENKPKETTPAETRPAESKPNETTPVDTEPAETQAKETEGTQSASTQPQMPTAETTNQNTEETDSRHSGSVWVWVAVLLAAVGSLGAAVFFLKKKSC